MPNPGRYSGSLRTGGTGTERRNQLIVFSTEVLTGGTPGIWSASQLHEASVVGGPNPLSIAGCRFGVCTASGAPEFQRSTARSRLGVSTRLRSGYRNTTACPPSDDTPRGSIRETRTSPTSRMHAIATTGPGNTGSVFRDSSGQGSRLWPRRAAPAGSAGRAARGGVGRRLFSSVDSAWKEPAATGRWRSDACSSSKSASS